MIINKINIKDKDYSYITNNSNSKTNILFIHGVISSGITFKSILDSLNDKYKYYAIDLPGFNGLEGYSEFNCDNLISYINDFLKYFNIDKLVLIGHSLGGIIAIKYYEKYSKRISKIVTLGSPISFNAIKHPYDYVINTYSGIENDSILNIINKLKSSDLLTSTAVSITEKISHEPFDYLNKSVGYDLASDLIKKTNPKLAIEYTNLLKDFDNREIINNINIPYLAIYGGNDAIVDYEYCNMNMNNENIKKEIIKDMNHAGLIINSKRSIELINDFLRV